MKKILGSIICIVFVLAVLVGCGNKISKQDDKPTVSTQTTQQNPDQGNSSADNITANKDKLSVVRDGRYTDKDRVAKYIYQYKALPGNYITKNEAKKLGWQTKGTLDKVAPGKSIGGDRYGDYENKLPKANNRKWTECDIDYVKGSRNAKRIVFSNDGLIYYTDDHYKSFSKLDVK